MGASAIGYIPIFIFLVTTLLFGAGTLFISYFVQSRVFNKDKLSPYECGSEPISDARIPYPARYYIIAVLFVIFDIEIIFLYPWAVAFSKIGLIGLVSMLIFIALFVLAFAYVWKKGGLEWD
jgi:NADH-quinone oxidoreductase subunit A